jgi:hypothetical protein
MLTAFQFIKLHVEDQCLDGNLMLKWVLEIRFMLFGSMWYVTESDSEILLLL